MVNYLKCLEKASVMEYNKAECLGIADTSYPSAHSHLFVQVLLFVPVNFFYCCKLHIYSPLFAGPVTVKYQFIKSGVDFLSTPH